MSKFSNDLVVSAKYFSIFGDNRREFKQKYYDVLSEAFTFNKALVVPLNMVHAFVDMLIIFVGATIFLRKFDTNQAPNVTLQYLLIVLFLLFFTFVSPYIYYRLLLLFGIITPRSSPIELTKPLVYDMDVSVNMIRSQLKEQSINLTNKVIQRTLELRDEQVSSSPESSMDVSKIKKSLHNKYGYELTKKHLNALFDAEMLYLEVHGFLRK